jgi:hypothetical protein
MKRHPFRRGRSSSEASSRGAGSGTGRASRRLWDDASKVDVGDLKQDDETPELAIVCRYSKEYEALVRQRMSEMHEKTLAFHGDKDLVGLPGRLGDGGGLAEGTALALGAETARRKSRKPSRSTG